MEIDDGSDIIIDNTLIQTYFDYTLNGEVLNSDVMPTYPVKCKHESENLELITACRIPSNCPYEKDYIIARFQCKKCGKILEFVTYK